MPTVAELQGLEGLVDRLLPLSHIQRGEIIRADDWNHIVGAVIELARAILADDSEESVPPHEHPEQVSVGWLEPRLRSLIERGTLSEPQNVNKLGELERRLTTVSTRVEEVQGHLGEVRSRVTEVSARDLARQTDVTAVRRAVDGLADARQDVMELRESLQGIRNDVKTAVEAANRFTLDGQPVDFGQFDQRLRGVEDLRNRLRLPSGETLDASSLETRLTQLTNTLITQQQLDDALRTRPGVIPPDAFNDLEGRLRTDINANVESSVNELGARFRADVTARLADVDALVSRAVSDAAAGVSASLLATVRPEIATAATKSFEDSRAAFERRLSETDRGLRDQLDQRTADLQQTLTNTLRSEVQNQIVANLGPLRQNIADIDARLTPLAAKLNENEAAFAHFNSRIEKAVRDVEQLGARLQETNQRHEATLNGLRLDLTVEMDRRDQLRSDELNTRFNNVNTTINTRFNEIRNQPGVARPLPPGAVVVSPEGPRGPG